MAFKEKDVATWAAQHAPGEQLVAFSPANSRAAPSFRVDTDSGGIHTNPSDAPGARRSSLVADLGFDTEQRVGFMIEDVFYALTDRQLLLGTRSSMRNRPKDLVHAAPREQVHVHWFGDDEGINQCRHLVTDFGDGHYRTDRIGLRALGKTTAADALTTAFLAALGDQTTEY